MAKKRDFEGNRLHHFELSDGNRTVRWVLIGILLAVALVAVMFGLMSALQTPAGWQAIKVSTAARNCSTDFVLMYDLGAEEVSATDERKTLTVFYTQVTEQGWQLFYNEAGATQTNGLYAINTHVNEQITVDAQLYAALEQLLKGGSRALYFGPVYRLYDDVFYSESEVHAAKADPTTDEQMGQYVQKLADFANDPEAIDLKLMGDNQVLLHVSDDYYSFTQENAIDYLLDLGWLRNAVVIDFMAQRLTDEGYTNGYLSSADGFTRNFDQRDTSYGFNIIDEGKLAGDMTYLGACSIAFLRSYPLHQEEQYRYYRFSDGRILTGYVDLTDGKSKTAAAQLVCYSETASCVDLALAALPVWAADDLSVPALQSLTEEDIYSIWIQDGYLRYNRQDQQIKATDPAYKLELTK